MKNNYYKLKDLTYRVRPETGLKRIVKNIEEFIEFKLITESGVYLIGTYYVGKSINIPHRIAQHLLEVIQMDYRKDINIKKCWTIKKELLAGNKIVVKQVSDDLEQENYCIQYFKHFYHLTNKTGLVKPVPKSKKTVVDLISPYDDILDATNIDFKPEEERAKYFSENLK